jgi:hypothetical protein
MLDENAPLPSTCTLQETLELVSLFMADAIWEGRKLPDNAEIFERLIPQIVLQCAVVAGWIPDPPRVTGYGVHIGFGEYITEEDWDRFMALMPNMRGIAAFYRENDISGLLNPAELFELFKTLADLSEEQIAYEVRCSGKTLQRLKKPGYLTNTQILKNLAEYMNRILGERLKSYPTLLSHGTATQLANLHWSRLVWLPKQY